MCECRGVTRPHPTEIPYLLAFFPSLRAASDRTLSVYFPIRADSYNGRFYDLEFRRLTEKHRHKFSDKDMEVLERELPRVKAHLAVLRPTGCPYMAAVVRIIDREVSAVSYKRLYLAGTDEAVAELEKLLPPSLKKIIAGRLSASADRSVGELEVDLRRQLSATRA